MSKRTHKGDAEFDLEAAAVGSSSLQSPPLSRVAGPIRSEKQRDSDDVVLMRRFAQVLLLLTLLSLAPAAAYFGWFRSSSSGDNGGSNAKAVVKSNQSVVGGDKTPATPAPSLSDEQERERQWIKYVGRPPFKHGETAFKPAVAPKPVNNLQQYRSKYLKADGGARQNFDSFSCFTRVRNYS
jgi:hypothetical protein